MIGIAQPHLGRHLLDHIGRRHAADDQTDRIAGNHAQQREDDQRGDENDQEALRDPFDQEFQDQHREELPLHSSDSGRSGYLGVAGRTRPDKAGRSDKSDLPEQSSCQCGLCHVLHAVRIDVEAVQFLAVGVDEDRREQRECRRLLGDGRQRLGLKDLLALLDGLVALRSLSSTASISLSTMPAMRFDDEWKWVRSTRSGSGDPVHQPQSIMLPSPPPGLSYSSCPRPRPRASED